MMLVFVYGSLKRGFTNHAYLIGQQFQDCARTVSGYRLFKITDYPGMVRDVHSQSDVEGEVWQLDDRCLASLDRVEGVAEGLFRREEIALRPPFDSAEVQTYLYNRSTAGCQPLGSRWEDFREEDCNSS